MEDLIELKKIYNFDESGEYIIIPFVSAEGKKKRCFLLKRRMIRIVWSDGRYSDYSLKEAIEACFAYPDMKLSAALRLIHGDGRDITRQEFSAMDKAIAGEDAASLEDDTAAGRAIQA